MDKPQASSPFKPLGRRLKELRGQINETLAEASGAVEIDVRQLASFELGQARPSEDVLLLLLSHFGVKDDEAIKLWDLAGYNMSKIPMSHMGSASTLDNQVAAGNNDHVLFTDIVDVIVNNYGVVMNFMQNTGSGTQPAVVAKIGMSREHAKSVLQILQLTLSQTEKNILKLPNKLIAPDSSSSDEIKSS
ncbi:helix-turn-helix transcriptional regulator [Candidatus Saccharibacteria bacterium]|nr:helix-turn-helix transcriptional regulator [Candidatus Saccharibacteria bacterium]